MATSKKASTKKAPTAGDSAEPPPPLRGCGKFFYPNGATYDGDWIFDANASLLPDAPSTTVATAAAVTEKPKGVRFKDGKGVFIDGNYSYEGEWTKDLANGEGIFKFASGAEYQGQWKMGTYCGTGKYKWPDGRSYSGEWRENKMHGKGVYTDKDGHNWTGQFFHGSGPGLTCDLQNLHPAK